MWSLLCDVSALFSYICLFVFLRPHLSSHWSPAYAVKQTPLINASALTLKQMKGETLVLFTCSQICSFILQSASILNVFVESEENQQTGKFIYLSKHLFHIFLLTVKLLSNMSAFVCYQRNFTQTTGVFIKYIAVCVSFLCWFYRYSPVLLQATSEVNRKQWSEAMDGKEPVGLLLSLLLTSLRVSLCVWSCFWSFVVSVPDLSFSDSKAGRE